MKKAIQLAVILLAFLPAVSFAQEKKASWPEMKNFHSIMASTFHPAEEGNLAPVKAKADSLFMAAQAWQKSPLPSNYKEIETKVALKKLVIRCAAVRKGVEANLTDVELKKLISAAHDAFHTIVGECKKTDE